MFVDDYYEVDMDILVYLDVVFEFDVVVVEELLLVVKLVIGLVVEWLELFLWFGFGGLIVSIGVNCMLVVVDGDYWYLYFDLG